MNIQTAIEALRAVFPDREFGYHDNPIYTGISMSAGNGCWETIDYNRENNWWVTFKNEQFANVCSAMRKELERFETPDF